MALEHDKPAYSAKMQFLLLLSVLSAAQPTTPPQCRCTDVTAACFKAVPFAALNASVGGRLIAVEDEFGACLTPGGLESAACAADLNRSDEEFFYTGQVGGYMHTGLAGVAGVQDGWSIAHHRLSSYAVAAETEADVSAGVAFAGRHNLRVAVKGTGHDW